MYSKIGKEVTNNKNSKSKIDGWKRHRNGYENKFKSCL